MVKRTTAKNAAITFTDAARAEHALLPIVATKPNHAALHFASDSPPRNNTISIRTG